jgi:hypothetical protein
MINAKCRINGKHENYPDKCTLDVHIELDLGGDIPLEFDISGVKASRINGCHPEITFPDTISCYNGSVVQKVREAIVEELVAERDFKLPDTLLVDAVRDQFKSILEVLEEHGQSLAFDEDTDTLFIGPKGLRWNSYEADRAPVINEEIEYRVDHCDIACGNIVFLHSADSTEYWA